MSDTSIIGIIAFLGSVMTIITPIMKLNSSIVKLNMTMETFNNDMASINKKVDAHTESLARGNTRFENHEIRITNLENKVGDHCE